ncbi:hypothetical protein [Noviherbaspirillum massiliense]|uniref:hypothetical protein n=1 Tax=Noviherbaspirillum massiliense TaxID=1465823 RepID=UPI001FE08837|nr:hypothetical protein [Noviherbaspirillum massiliense]
MQQANYPADSPTRLAREFNVRFTGSPISVHAARKWIVGEAMPTQEKLRTLAAWLGVSAEWLRFGTGGSETDTSILSTRLQSEDLALLSDLQQLEDKHRQIVRTMIRMLLHAQK